MSALKKVRGRRWWLAGATLVAAVSFGVVFVAASGAAPSPCPIPGNFEIDGDMTQQTCSPGADDWNTPNIGVQSTTQGGTYSTAGKDGGDPSTWVSSGSTPDKTNFAQAYATSRVVNGHFFVFVAWERTSTTGTQGYAIEVTNSGSNTGADGTPQPNRTGGGAVFYISSQGASAPVFNSACSYTSQSNYGQTCTSSDASVTMAINTASMSDPLNNTTQPAGAFFEVALDVTGLTGITPSCPGAAANAVYLRSITGQTSNGNLKGYMAPLNVAPDSTCVPPPITTTATPGGSSAAIGSTQHDEATVGTTGAFGSGSVKFFLCSPAEVTANGGDCKANGTQVGTAVTLNSSGFARSADIGGGTTPNDNSPGTYCWRAEFTPDSNDHHYVAGSHTNSTTECFTVVKNSPAIVTTPSPTSVTLGTSSVTLNDSAVLSGGHSPTGTITFTLVYKGATVDTETVSVSGNGSYATPTGYTLPTSGTVTGTYQWNAIYSGDGNNLSASENNDPSEQVTVGKANPSLVTTASPNGTVTLGTSSVTLNDSAVLSGGYHPTGTITFTLSYKGSPVYTDNVAVGSGNGTYSTAAGDNPGGYTLPTSGAVTGSYVWTAVYNGDGNNSTATDPGTSAQEQVSINPASPAVVTTASPHGTVTLDSGASPTLNDSAVLSGGYHPTGVITFTLKYKGATVYTDHVDVSGNGTYSTASGDEPGGYTLPTASTVTGSYVWTAVYSGDANNDTATDPGTSDQEQVTVNSASPTVVTTATPASVTVPASVTFSDSAVFAGGYHPTGTLTFTLTGPNGFTYTQKDTVSGNGTYTASDGPISNPDVGTYTWSVSYSGDGNNDGAVDQGGRNEQTVVSPAGPSIATTPDPSSVTLGAGTVTLKDSAVLSGGSKPTGTIVFTLVYKGVTVDTETVSVSGNGTYSTPTGYTLPGSGTVTGTYQWNATYSGDANNNSASENNDVSERVTVNPAEPAISTTPSETAGSVNDLLNDTAHLSGGAHYDGSGAITFRLYGPSDPTCAGTPAYTETVKADHNGDYSTSNTTVLANSPGIWNWTATFGGDTNNAPAVSGCGAEQVAIAAPLIHIQKTADAPQVNAGDNIGFTMTVWNTGSGNAKGVVLTDVLPKNPGLSWSVDKAGAGFGSGADCSISLGVLTCGPETVPAGTDKADSTFWVHITSQTDKSTGGPCDQTGGLVDNTGHVSTTNDGTDDSTATVCVAAPAIHIEKTADKSQVNAGDPIGFTITVWNSGNGDAYQTTLTDTLPTNPGLSWNVDAGSGWGSSCSVQAGVLTCGPVTVPAGTAKGDPAYVVHLTSDTTGATGGDCQQTGLVDNTGSVTTSNDGQGDSSAEICVAAPVIHIKKTADKTQVSAGDDIGFTMTVWNSGGGDAYKVNLSDPLPQNPGLNWKIAGQGSGWDSTCQINGGELDCGPVTVPANTTQENSSFTVHVTSTTDQTTAGDCQETGLVDNTGTVTTGNDGSDQSSATVCVSPANVSITKTADHSAPVHAGDPIGFTVEIKNTGTGAANGVNLSDPLPAGSGSGVTWAIDSSVGSPSQFVLSGPQGSQTLGLASSTLPAGADYKVHITARTSDTECGTYDNTATLTTSNANNPDPASAEESCVYRVDLSVTKSGSPATQEIGAGNITWTMVVTNNGPDTDTGVKISDPMPGGNTYVSSTTTQGTCTGGAILTCDIGPMAAGASVTITLITTPSATGPQTNTVVVSGDRPETNLANNTASATVEITGHPFLPCINIARITPGHLIVGRKTLVTIYLAAQGRVVKGTRVRIKGAGINVKTKGANRKGIIKRSLKMKRKGILVFTPLADKSCGARRIGVRGVFTPPVTG